MVERKELLENTRKIIEKRAAQLNQVRKEPKHRVWGLKQSQLILMRRKKLLAKLKEELDNIKQENLKQMLEALEVS